MDTNDRPLLPPANPSIMEIIEDIGLDLHPHQLAIIRDTYGVSLAGEVATKARVINKGRPQLTYHIGLMAHVALYGSDGGTEIQEEGLEDRIDAYYGWIRRWLYLLGHQVPQT